jgi:hypothetical protein
MNKKSTNPAEGTVDIVYLILLFDFPKSDYFLGRI